VSESTAARTVGYVGMVTLESWARRITSRTPPISRASTSFTVVGELIEHGDRGHVDERNCFGVEHDGARARAGDSGTDLVTDVLGVGEVEAALGSEDHEARDRDVVFVTG
jgi:hypothetical protein